MWNKRHVGCVSVMVLMVLAAARSEGVTVLEYTTSASYVTVGTPSILQLPTDSPMTVEGWMYLKALDTRDILYSKNNGRTSPYSYMFGVTDYGKLAAFNGVAWIFPTNAVLVQTGTWNHVAFSFDGTNLSFFLNGDLVGDPQPFTFTNTLAHNVKIGGYNTGSDPLGYVSDVRVWNGARSAQQIADWKRFRLFGNEAGLVGYWPMDEGSGLTVYDGTTNGNNGVITACVWAQTALELGPPFLLADPVTGSTRFTATNEVEVISIPTVGYTHYQIVPEGGLLQEAHWQPVSAPPTNVVFAPPVPDGPVWFTLWLTNDSLGGVAFPVSNTITYVTSGPEMLIVPEAAREVSPGQPVRVTAAELDVGSLSGESGGEPIGFLSVKLLPDGAPLEQAADSILLPGAGGAYRFRLVGVNEAGLQDVSDETCLFAVLPVTLAVEPFTGLPNTRYEWPELWDCRWPQQWLIDYIGGANPPEPIFSAGTGTHEDHNALGYYIDFLSRRDMRVRVDLRFTQTTTSNYGGLLARFRPPSSGQRLGYRLRFFPNANTLYLERLVGNTATTLTSTSFSHSTTAIFRMLMEVEQVATNRTAIRAKMWNRDDPEPIAWTLAASDTSASLQNVEGSAGLYGVTSGNRRWQFYNFKVNALPFILADPETGSFEATRFGEARVAAFQAPTGYDVYAITTNADLAPEAGWLPVTNPPTTVVFDNPTAESWISTYCWFTNLTGAVTACRYENRLFYTAALPEPAIKTVLAFEAVPGAAVTLSGADLDAGSTGGPMGTGTMAVFCLTPVCLTPGADAIPDDGRVTLTGPGQYELALAVTNSAGLGALSSGICTVTVTEAETAAADLYVIAGHTNPVAPYASWQTAAPDIQTAADAAETGATILVWKGLYETGGRTNAAGIIQNRVTLDKPLRLAAASTNPADTVIRGAPHEVVTETVPFPVTNRIGANAVRGVWIGTNAVLEGFTVEGGATRAGTGNDARGGGVWSVASGLITNCVIADNIANEQGGGLFGGAMVSGRILGNRSLGSGGGAAGAVLRDCTVADNNAVSLGGGVRDCTVYRGVISRNFDRTDGAGGGGGYNSTFYSSLIASNRGAKLGGGLYGGTAYNSVLVGNRTTYPGGGFGGGAYNAWLINCTVVGNRASVAGGGVRSGRLVNGIVYGNSARNGSLFANYTNDATLFITNSCTEPAIDGWAEGNIALDPRWTDPGTAGSFVANVDYWTYAPGIYTLKPASPCQNAGTNEVWMLDPQDPRSADMAGGRRLMGPAVDMGAYESVPRGTMIMVW